MQRMRQGLAILGLIGMIVASPAASAGPRVSLADMAIVNTHKGVQSQVSLDYGIAGPRVHAHLVLGRWRLGLKAEVGVPGQAEGSHVHLTVRQRF